MTGKRQRPEPEPEPAPEPEPEPEPEPIPRGGFDERFHDDFIKVVLKYLPPLEKTKFECVSKKWKRCIYTEAKYLTIGLNTYDSLLLTPNLVYTYPRVIPQLQQNYRFIQRLDINMAISETYGLPFINSFEY